MNATNVAPTLTSGPQSPGAGTTAAQPSAPMPIVVQPTTTAPTPPPVTHADADPNAPTIGLLTDLGESTVLPDGSFLNVVGDTAEAVITAPKVLKTVAWKIDGAIQIHNYQYNQAIGEAIAQDNPDTEDLTNFNTTQAGFDFYWNGEARVHTVSAHVTYADGTEADSNVLSVNVQAPKLDSFVDQYVAPAISVLQINGMNNVGLNDGSGGQPGQSFYATVDMPADVRNHGGTFFFLQLVNTSRTAKDADGDVVGSQDSKGSFLLDAPGGADAANLPPNYAGYTSSDNPAGLTNVMIPESPYAPGTISDSPFWGENAGNYPNAAYATTLTINDQFKMYLMFQSDSGVGGIPIAVGMIQWSFNATATYKGPANGDPSNYTNLDNWNATFTTPQFNPNGPNVINGGPPDTPIPEWDDNVGSLQ